MRIALAQLNPTVGQIEVNADRIIDAIGRAVAESAQLVVFPELALLGYPPKDLLLKDDLLSRCEQAVQRIAQQCTSIAALVGTVAPNNGVGLPLWNAAVFCRDGQVETTLAKTLLPTYDVFDERRYFEPATEIGLVQIGDHTIGVSICEDLWNDDAMFERRLYDLKPVADLAAAGADFLVNCSASPFVADKHAFRLELFAHTAKQHNLPLIYCNQVGGNDELVFDGNSCVFDSEGQLIAHAKDFAEDLLVVDVQKKARRDEGTEAQRGTDAPADSENPAARLETPRLGMASIFSALTLGLRDYCRKCGFKKVVLGLSGGIDSAVTAVVAVEALGAANVTGITMPSRHSSAGSVSDAEQLAKNMGIAFHDIPIEPAHAAAESMLSDLFAKTEPGLAEENIQARLRGLILMAHSNKFGAMLISTGNKSEMAVGYCTLYGDMAGGLAILSDVPKTVVYDLARWINSPDSGLAGPIPDASITKPPSAELRPDQTDQDSLPPYDQLDAIIERYIEHHQTAQRIIAETGLAADLVDRVIGLIDRNEYKRKQAAPGLKVTARAFGFGRRMPIAQRYGIQSR
jgi:NAD+ synthase (glutamine-hydrolysing)